MGEPAKSLDELESIGPEGVDPSPHNLMLGHEYAHILIARASNDQDLQGFTRRRGYALDANDLTAVFARELEYIDQVLVLTEFAPLKGEQLVPYDACGGPGVDSWTWRQVTELGAAEFISDQTDVLPNVDVVGSELNRKVESLGASWQIFVQDLKRIAMNPTIHLDVERKKAAYNAIRRLHDATAMAGNTGFGWTGLINDANVPVVTQAGSGTAWATATALEMVADANKLFWAVYANTLGNHEPELLLVPDVVGPRLDQPIGDNADKTVRSFLLANTKYKDIQTTHYLNLADAGGDGPRIMAYIKSKDALVYGANSMYEEEPMQRNGLRLLTPCHGRSSGTQFKMPLTAAYMDVD